jgi:hypothetical protein
MTGEERNRPTPGNRGEAKSRRARLGQELRANLLRRKEQARARRKAPAGEQEFSENNDIAEPQG